MGLYAMYMTQLMHVSTMQCRYSMKCADLICVSMSDLTCRKHVRSENEQWSEEHTFKLGPERLQIAKMNTFIPGSSGCSILDEHRHVHVHASTMYVYITHAH